MEENNKLIVKFLNWETINTEGYIEYILPKSLADPIYKLDSRFILEFDTNWNWLMEVVEKIKNNSFVTNVNYNIERDFIIEGLTSTKVLNIIINRENFKSDLEMCYFGVVEFIKWYNQNLKKDN